MDKNDFLKKLLSTFKIEAKEHIALISNGLIEMEKAEPAEKQMEIIEAIFREAHSLKGAARSVNILEIESVCQSLESVFAALKRGEVTLSPQMFDIFHMAVDILGNLLLSAGAEQPAEVASRIKEIKRQLERVNRVSGPELSSTASAPQPQLAEVRDSKPEPQISAPRTPAMQETVRIPTAKLDSVLLQVEGLLSAKLSASQRATEMEEIDTAFAAWRKELVKISPDIRIVRESVERKSESNGQSQKDSRITRLIEFLEWNDNFVKSLHSKLISLEKSAEHDQRSLGSMVDNLLTDTKKVLMLPFSSLLEIFPKLVRDLSHAQGKDVKIVISGGDIDIDRRILDEMKDPFIHLVRNCVDHGIEKPEERARRNKPLPGTITIAVTQANSRNVDILILDDGAGIDVEKAKASAVRLGILSQSEADELDEQKTLSLVFHSGVSTSPIITDVSGRGLGLAIVREKVEKLGGAVICESHRGSGTALRMMLPLTLATFRGVLVSQNEHLYVIPTTYMDKMKRIKKDEIKTIENRETISLDGLTIPFVPLYAALELPQKEKRSADNEDINGIHVIILSAGEKSIAFGVDEVLNEQEILVKGLGKQLSRVRNVAGATVLGTGKVVPILNVPDLMKSAIKASSVPFRAAVAVEETAAKKQSVLVVEDSITARTLLKNILESAGYDVKTTVDGIDAFTALKTEDFDIVVSDVDMPRMNGFDLTSKIRSDKKLADLPVVLVTALESRADRERGIDAGANAYIVKSSFDQSNLLEVIKRLI